MRDATETTELRELLAATARAARDSVPVLQSLHGRIERALVTGKTGAEDPHRDLSGLAQDVLEDLDDVTGSARILQQELDALWRNTSR